MAKTREDKPREDKPFFITRTFSGNKGYVKSVAFSPDGQYLLSGSRDKTIKLWLGINWQDWLAVGCARLRLHSVFVSSQTAKDASNTCLKFGLWTKEKMLA